jgi:hypothetical protein
VDAVDLHYNAFWEEILFGSGKRIGIGTLLEEEAVDGEML